MVLSVLVGTYLESSFTYEDGEDFYTYAHCGNAYDPTIETILDDVPNDLDDICKGDIGCIMDGKEIGNDAALDYEEDPAVERERETKAPTASPTTSSAPTTSLSPTFEPSSSPSQARSSTSNAQINGDPHCKYPC